MIHIPELKPGERPGVRHWKAMLEALRRCVPRASHGSGTVVNTGPGGTTVSFKSRRGGGGGTSFPARIQSRIGSSYGWTAVYKDDLGAWQDVEPTDTGLATEMNGSVIDPPFRAVVFRDSTSGLYYFQMEPC